MMYRTEHPKPQWERNQWMNLNGLWDFKFDHGNSGEARKLYSSDASYSQQINVPFCPESKLSGIEHKDFMSSIWYKRKFTLEKEQLQGNVFLHFGAVDYVATIYINGEKCGSHKGGYVSFSVDITEYVVEGENVVVVHAEDDTRSPFIPSGKQSGLYESFGCMYTRTTGIWQTVWLEFVPKTYIKKVKYYPNVQAGAVTIHAELVGTGNFSVQAFFEGKPMGEIFLQDVSGFTVATLYLKEKHLWKE